MLPYSHKNRTCPHFIVRFSTFLAPRLPTIVLSIISTHRCWSFNFPLEHKYCGSYSGQFHYWLKPSYWLCRKLAGVQSLKSLEALETYAFLCWVDDLLASPTDRLRFWHCWPKLRSKPCLTIRNPNKVVHSEKVFAPFTPLLFKLAFHGRSYYRISRT